MDKDWINRVLIDNRNIDRKCVNRLQTLKHYVDWEDFSKWKQLILKCKILSMGQNRGNTRQYLWIYVEYQHRTINKYQEKSDSYEFQSKWWFEPTLLYS